MTSMQRPLKSAANIRWPPSKPNNKPSIFTGCMCSVEEDADVSAECSATFTYDPNNNAKDLEDEDLEDLCLNDLESICTIGTGTFGRVELTKHKKFNRHFALKILNIHKIVATRQVDHVHNEKRILSKISHPFIVTLYATEMDDRNLYMIMEFVPGGELFSYLRAARKFTCTMACFYSAEIASALAFLHSKSIVYRDLKPENLMLTKEGHIKMADFGFAKELRDRVRIVDEDKVELRTYTMCGTPEYLAPESVTKKGHNKAVDWWALGILIYEMMVGKPPFRGQTTPQIYAAILEHHLKFPKSFDLVAKDLVRKLLEEDRTRRLGCMKGGARDVMQHRFFAEINWDDLYNLKVTPPIIPTLYHAGDTGNFDSYDENIDDGPIAIQRERDLFENW